ncbi:MAG TPA: hypothetical protein V6C85_11085 [Allocoleopsis sp.]
MNFISDWAILNDTKSKQLERILTEFYRLSNPEINQACSLLESYHAVYRRNRLEQRRNQRSLDQPRINRGCPPPTAIQLHEIAQRMHAKAGIRLQAEQVKTQLHDLAKRLRQYRHHVRENLGVTVFSDNSNTCVIGDRFPSSHSMNHRDEREEPTEPTAWLSGGLTSRSQCKLLRNSSCCSR